MNVGQFLSAMCNRLKRPIKITICGSIDVVAFANDSFTLGHKRISLC